MREKQKPKKELEHGGQRPGSGRKPTGPKVHRLIVSFTEEELGILKMLEQLGYGKKRSWIIRRALQEALERIKTQP